MVINKKIARELPKSEKKLQMVITVDDDVGVLVQGLGQHPKRKLLCWWWKNKQNIRKKPEKHINGVRDVRHYLQGLLQGLPQKGKLTWFDQKVKKNKMRMILPVRVHLMGCWDGGHMTNSQKWSKNISCSPLLWLPESVWIMFWSAPVVEIWCKWFWKAPRFFLFFVFFSMKTKSNNIISRHLES